LGLDDDHLDNIPLKISGYILMADGIVKLTASEFLLSLVENLKELEYAGYDPESEMTSRLAAEYVMVPAIARAQRVTITLGSKKRVALFASPKRTSSGYYETRKPLDIYPEFDLRAEVEGPSTEVTYVVTGRADSIVNLLIFRY
jgi:hypothetical protein